MDGLSEDLLADAGLAKEQHGRVHRRHERHLGPSLHKVHRHIDQQAAAASAWPGFTTLRRAWSMMARRLGVASSSRAFEVRINRSGRTLPKSLRLLTTLRRSLTLPFARRKPPLLHSFDFPRWALHLIRLSHTAGWVRILLNS